MSDTVKIEKGTVRMIAHRGLSGIELENTNAAFIAAGNRSYFGIETDIHRTADGRFIVFHDDETGRLCENHCIVEQTDYAALRAMPLIGENGVSRIDQRMPELSEYLSICKKYGKTAILELKTPMSETDIAAVCEIISGADYLEQTVFISFCFENLATVKRLYPRQTVQLLTCEFTPELPQRLAENGMDLDLLHTALTREAAQRCHAAGVRVNVWTVDDPEEARRCIACGTDFITTNILE